jgi:GlpG protein
MFIVGELKDYKMALEIIKGLNSREIPAQYIFDISTENYIIQTESNERLEEARDFYRVKLGIAKPIEIDQKWVKIRAIPRGELTRKILLACVGLYLLSFSTIGNGIYDLFYIGKVESGFLYEISKGQVWRLITPIFLHLSFLHVLFNMLWFNDLGNLIENSFGKKFLIKFILISAFASNLFQNFINGPTFGGMSGVIYAMFGFIWVHHKLDTSFEFSLPKFDIGMMIGWFFICLTGLLGPIANSAHGGGLITGILIAVFLNFKPDRLRFKFLFLALFFLIFTVGVEGYKLDGRFYILLSLL